MKTELEKKLNKLPEYIELNKVKFCLDIGKYKENDILMWCISYIDYCDNILFSVQHQSLQAAVDTMLSEIKKL